MYDLSIFVIRNKTQKTDNPLTTCWRVTASNYPKSPQNGLTDQNEALRHLIDRAVILPSFKIILFW